MFALAIIAGSLPTGISSITGIANVEASNHESQTHSQQSVSNQQAISSAIEAHGADKWHEAGFKGAGVKIGVIDFGFEGIQAVMGTEAPASVQARCFPTFSLTGQGHTDNIADCEAAGKADAFLEGTGGAELIQAVFDIAPEADYYIGATNRKGFSELKNIVDWMIAEDVDIIVQAKSTALWVTPGTASTGQPFLGGFAPIDNVDNAVANGIVWVNAAGNFANDTWTGAFSDIDGNGYHDFNSINAGGDPIECNPVTLDEQAHRYGAVIRWADSWGDLNSDIDLVMKNQNTLEIETVSRRLELPGFENYPLEAIDLTTPAEGSSYCLSVELKAPTGKPLTPPDWIQLHSLQGHRLGIPSQWGSISDPAEASSEGMLAVGAASFDSSSGICETSSRGPAVDGRTKPDIVGGVSTCEHAGHQHWRGTGEAAAHVAGLAALVKQRYPDYTPEQVANYLRDNAASRSAEEGDPNPTADTNNTWGHGFAMLPASDVEGVTPSVPLPDDPKAAAKAFVEEAIAAYRADPDAAKTYYQSEASVDRNTDLYLFIIDGTEIIVNGGFAGAVGEDITSRIGIDAIGKEYGKEIAAADENGTFVDYLIPDPLHNFTLYRKHTWAIKADGLIFAAGSWDKTEDVESTLEPHEDVVAFIYKAGARLLAFGGDLSAVGRIILYYNTQASIDGERYVFLVAPDGTIAADATMPNLVRTNISNLPASDDPTLGQKIAAVQEGESLWFSHMWPNPATDQEEQKYTYVTRFQGMIFGSGYYGGAPPPGLQDPCFTSIDGSGTHTGSWDDTCLSANRPDGVGGDSRSDYYARFFTFTLDEDTSVTIDLTSEEDTFLYLMEGSENDGAIETENDDISSANHDSRIEAHTLSAGTYTIEATTYNAERAGEFTLVLEIEEVDEPPTPEPDMTFIAISSGANHVCAIATDGSIMCWGDNDYGQVSDRPTSGSFTDISSGDNHTCALRNDGAVICWGSFDVP